MNLQEFQNEKDNAYWKVLSSTFQPSSESIAMIGGVYKQAIYNDEDKMIALKDKTILRYFMREDIQRMTPVIFNGEKVGIGDRVNGNEVFDYTFDNGEYALVVAINDYNTTAIVKDITEHNKLFATENKIIVEIKTNNLTLEQLKTKSLGELVHDSTLENTFNEKDTNVLYKGDTKYNIAIEENK